MRLVANPTSQLPNVAGGLGKAPESLTTEAKSGRAEFARIYAPRFGGTAPTNAEARSGRAEIVWIYAPRFGGTVSVQLEA